MDRPTIVEHLAHCGCHARRFKNLSWEDTATLSSYISSLEHQLSTARAEALKEAAEAISKYNQMSEHAVNDDYLIGYGFGVRDCQIRIEQILADKQEPPR